MRSKFQKEIRYRVGKLRVQPGDTLIVSYEDHINPERLRDEMAELQAQGHFTHNRILIFPKGVDLSIVETSK